MAVIRYRPEVDGLRAVAILGVLLFHLNSKLLPGGFVGVDVFFVISGYLITSIIYEEANRGTFSLVGFYTRRLKRLFPAMAVVLIAVLAMGMIIEPTHSAPIRKACLWVLLLCGNIYIWKVTGDYWASGVDQMPLLHTWSLAVEEHFYLAFPITLILLLRWKRRLVLPLFLLVTIFSFVFCVLCTAGHPTAAFYLIPTRAWELLMGCLLALYPPALSGRLANHRWAGILAGIGLVIIGLSYVVLQGGDDFPGYRAALPVIGAALVIAYTGGARARSPAERFLLIPGIVHIGKASYSLYLWHWPVIVFLKAIQDHPVFAFHLTTQYLGAAYLVSAFALAQCSFQWIERPLRSWRWTPLLCAFVFAAMVGYIAVGSNSPSLEQRAGHKLQEGFAHLTIKGRLYSLNQETRLSTAGAQKYRNVEMLLPERPPKIEKGIVRAYGSGPAEVVVFGDSHSLMYAPLIDEILREHRISGCFFCADGVSPALLRSHYQENLSFGTAEDLKTYDHARKLFLDTHRPKVTVWIQRYDETPFEEIRESIQYILDRSTCIFVQQAPVLNIGDFCTVDTFGYFRNIASKPLDRLNIVEKQSVRLQRSQFEAAARNAFQANQKFVWFETSKELLASDGRIRWWDGADKLYYVDDDHLSEYGVQLFRQRLEQTILRNIGAE